MNNIKYIFSAAAFMLSVGLTSCTSDLDVNPIDPNLKTKVNTKAESALNKCYATIAMAGNGGANGDSDVDGIDGGTSGYIRQLFNTQELTTDEAICAWGGDEGILNFNFNTYDASHPMLKGFIAVFTQVLLTVISILLTMVTITKRCLLRLDSSVL